MEDNAAWYQTWFNTPFYHTLYQDRNIAEAQFFLHNLIQHLSIKNTDRILDIACGRGRHALYLAEQGFNVTGIDLSPNSISFAQKEATSRGLDAQFYVHDMRDVAKQPADVVLNLFTSIGYFEDKPDNTKALKAFYDSLAPNGMAVIDFLHTPWVKKHWVADEVVIKDGITFTLKRSFSKGWIKKDISFVHEGKPFAFTERVAALERSDFEQMFSQVGFTLKNVFGDYALTPFDSHTAERLILVVQK